MIWVCGTCANSVQVQMDISGGGDGEQTIDWPNFHKTNSVPHYYAGRTIKFINDT